jgi:hypothetical protein
VNIADTRKDGTIPCFILFYVTSVIHAGQNVGHRFRSCTFFPSAIFNRFKLKLKIAYRLLIMGQSGEWLLAVREF